MSRAAFPWHSRPGLAGGIDKNGSRAEELLGLGFGSVEFGTVAADPAAPHPLAPLVRCLAALPPRSSGACAIGIGIGLAPGAPPSGLPAAWVAGLAGAWPVADYVSFNLSAQANRPFLAPRYRALVAAALAAVAAEGERLPRRPRLALKFPLGADPDPLPWVAELAAAAGFDILTTVLPEGSGRYARLAAQARRLAGGPALVAVGGIRHADDIDAARAAGAAGVQVHRVFVERGAACLPPLLAGEPYCSSR